MGNPVSEPRNVFAGFRQPIAQSQSSFKEAFGYPEIGLSRPAASISISLPGGCPVFNPKRPTAVERKCNLDAERRRWDANRRKRDRDELEWT
jgi:hypothetical protein